MVAPSGEQKRLVRCSWSSTAPAVGYSLILPPASLASLDHFQCSLLSQYAVQCTVIHRFLHHVRIASADCRNNHGRSVCPSVCLSVVSFRCFVQTNEDTIIRFSLTCSTVILVSEEVKLIRKFAVDHPNEGVKLRSSTVASENLTDKQP